MKKLFYDISELGWVRYLSAHLNYLYKNGEKVSICTNESRCVFYRGIVDEILPIPNLYYEKFGEFQSDGNCLYDTVNNKIISDHLLISKPFKESYPDYDIVTNYSTFFNQRIFEPYLHSKESEEYCKKFRNCILVFPRYRESKFSRRNLGKDNWIKIIKVLCQKYPDIDIITIGGKNATYDINLNYNNYYNLMDNNNMLDILVCLCNTKKVISTFGTESGISLIGTICKANSFIVGQDKERIMYENFCEAVIQCYYVKESNEGYVIRDFDNIIDKFLSFTDLMLFLSKEKYF